MSGDTLNVCNKVRSLIKSVSNKILSSCLDFGLTNLANY